MKMRSLTNSLDSYRIILCKEKKFKDTCARRKTIPWIKTKETRWSISHCGHSHSNKCRQELLNVTPPKRTLSSPDGGLPLEYLTAQTKCTQGISNLLRNLCKRLWLWVCKFKMPNPPLSYGTQAIGQAAFGGFLLFDIKTMPQTVLTKLINLFDKCFGQQVGWHCKVGRALKTTLVSCSLPAWLRKLEMLTSLLSHLETRGQ